MLKLHWTLHHFLKTVNKNSDLSKFHSFSLLNEIYLNGRYFLLYIVNSSLRVQYGSSYLNDCPWTECEGSIKVTSVGINLAGCSKRVYTVSNNVQKMTFTYFFEHFRIGFCWVVLYICYINILSTFLYVKVLTQLVLMT